ncbi:hypothetical protein [Streptomyces sp. NPDC085665]|uniref:hypothetical protein n=1 Tax=Streptomyces sp. NPDC085665 TaxID=3365735 RepID=UPI0037D07265
MTTHYAFSIKALPAQPDPAALNEPPSPPDARQPPPADDGRQWAGDPYDEGDESDPGAAFAAFTGTNGEEAWLDRGPDGTLTGWVRDATGQVWRYVDDSAWALDVDGAQMDRVSTPSSAGNTPGTAPAGATDAAPSIEQDPMWAPGAEPEVDEDPFADADDEELEESDLGADDPDMEESTAEDEESDEDPDAPFPGAKKLKKKGGK